MDRRDHWNDVYRTKDSTEVSWFEPEPLVSLRLIEGLGLGPESRILDVGGGTSTLVDCLLRRGYRRLGVLDVSPTSIEIGRARLGERAVEVEWFVEDVTEFQSPHPWDLWHDRALFHFLTEKDEQLAYRQTLLSAVAEGGVVVIATFGPEGPLKCSGLDVCRYDASSLRGKLGSDFELLHDEIVDHTTPGGSLQQFLYCRFRRKWSRAYMTKKPDRASAPATRGIRIRWPRLYDAMNRLHFLGREREFREWTADQAAIRPGQTVLDVGCGTGVLTLALKRRAGTDGAVDGIDAAPEMIEAAQRKAAAQRLDVRYQVGLIEDLPFADNRFDVVLSSLILHHLPKDLKRKGITEITRVLRPGGRLVAVDVDPPLLGNLRTVEEAMRAVGFTEVRRGKTKFRTMFVRVHYLSGTAGQG